jgi:hypothetical protein
MWHSDVVLVDGPPTCTKLRARARRPHSLLPCSFTAGFSSSGSSAYLRRNQRMERRRPALTPRHKQTDTHTDTHTQTHTRARAHALEQQLHLAAKHAGEQWREHAGRAQVKQRRLTATTVVTPLRWLAERIFHTHTCTHTCAALKVCITAIVVISPSV